MTMTTKSQVGIEFMAFVVVLLLLLLVIASNSSFFAKSMVDTRVYAEGKKMSDSIAFEINMAVKVGDGYKRRFMVGNDIFGIQDFLIMAQNYNVIIDWNSGFVSSTIVAKDVQGSFSKGWNTINNSGGIIYVS